MNALFSRISSFFWGLTLVSTLLGGSLALYAGPVSGETGHPWSKVRDRVQENHRSYRPGQNIYGHAMADRVSRLAVVNGRIAAAANPDSVLLEEYDGSGGFQATFSYRLIRNSAGKLTQARLWIPPSPPLPSFQVGQALMSYTPQGQLLQVSFFENLPTTVETFRLMQPVDSRGNCTSVRYMDDDGSGNLVLSMGDSLAFTYMGTAITGFVYRTYNADLGLWEPSLRATAIIANANGQPTSFDLEFWDEGTGTWSPLKFRYGNLLWDLGFGSWMQSIGEYVVNAEDLIAPEGLMDLHRLSPSGPTEPTRFLVQLVSGPLLTPFGRRTPLSSGGQLQRFTDQEQDSAGQWFSTSRTNLVWSAGVLNSLTQQDSSTGSWMDDTREVRRYNANGDLEGQKYETWITGQGWSTDDGSEALITYQPNNVNRIASWIRKEYDSFAGVWDTVARYTLTYALPSSVCPGCLEENRWSVYPNPVQDRLVINGVQTGSEIAITDALGRQMLQRQIMEGESSLNLEISSWERGAYVVRLTEAGGRVRIQRLVKP